MLAEKYFALIVPVCVCLLGGALVACWRVQRSHRYLLWLAAAYGLSALALGAQSLMSQAQIAQWAVATGVVYLAGAWAMARGIAGRYGLSAHPGFALAVSAVVLAALYHYSWNQPDLLTRMHWLNAGLGLLQLLPARQLLRLRTADPLEAVMRWTYVVFAGYTLARPLIILAWAPSIDGVELARTVYWLVTLAGSMLFGLLFAMVLLACTVRDVMVALREERNQDPLTRLLNRRAFMEAAHQDLATPGAGPWVVLACDVDHFKQVNDTWGHTAGDAVLQDLARVLLSQVRAGDRVARFGGEEFVALLQGVDTAGGAQIAERMRQQLAATHFASIQGRVTASFGVAPLRAHEELHLALDQADAMLYQAKQAGRNRICQPQPAAAVAVLASPAPQALDAATH